MGSGFVRREGGCGGCRRCVITAFKRRSITNGELWVSDLHVSGCGDCIDDEVGEFDSIGDPSWD